MPSHRAYLSLFFGMFAFLTGCATIVPQSETPTTASWETRESALNKINQWQINGKIAVQTANDSGSATINWTQNQQQYAISLTGPLGAGGMQLAGAPGHVTLTNAKGAQFTAATPEQLLAKQWGYDLPVSNLRYWVRGLPVPGMASSKQFDNFHRLATLTQQGWQIQFLGYTNKNGIELPRRISVSSSALKAKMVIYDWNINHSR